MPLFILVLIICAAAWRRRGHQQVAALARFPRVGVVVPVAALAGIAAGIVGVFCSASVCGAVLGAQAADGVAGLILLAAAAGKAIEPAARPLLEPTRSAGAVALAQGALFVASPAGMALFGLGLVGGGGDAGVDAGTGLVAFGVEAAFVMLASSQKVAAHRPTLASKLAAGAAVAAGGVAYLV